MNFMDLFQVDLPSDVSWWAFLLVLLWFFLAFNTDIFLQSCVCSFFFIWLNKMSPWNVEGGTLQKVRAGLVLSPLLVWERWEMGPRLLALMAMVLPGPTLPPSPPLSSLTFAMVAYRVLCDLSLYPLPQAQQSNPAKCQKWKNQYRILSRVSHRNDSCSKACGFLFPRCKLQYMSTFQKLVLKPEVLFWHEGLHR